MTATLVNLLIWLIVFGVIFGVIYYVMNMIATPQPIRQIVLLIVGAVALIMLLTKLLPILSHLGLVLT